MRRAVVCAFVAVVALTVQTVRADDLTGVDRMLCASVQATYCLEGGECAVDLPWNLNIPEFIEIDLVSKQLRTTRASGENRTTTIEHLSRRDGTIVLQGFEMGRAFSFAITEDTGHLVVAVAREGRGVVVFGACTPMTSPAASGSE